MVTRIPSEVKNQFELNLLISHALAGGRSLAEVKAIAGHSTLTTTSVDLHIAVVDDARQGRLFAFQSYGGITVELGKKMKNKTIMGDRRND